MNRLVFCLIFFILPLTLFAQLDAGPDDTINKGVPVTLTATYGMIGIGINTTDDGVEGPFPIGFTFTFFGKRDSVFWIGANGWIAFSPNVQARGIREIHQIPNRGDNYSPVDCIFGPFVDLNPIQANSPHIFYQTVGKAPGRQLVVMWCECPLYECLDSTLTCQIILNEGSNTIETHIMHKPYCSWLDNKAVLGVQNISGYLGYSAPGYNNTSWSAKNIAWRFTPATPDSFQVAQILYDLKPLTPGNKITYTWYSGGEVIAESQSVTVAPGETTRYTVYARICAGDEFYDSLTVYVHQIIPNAFTPNGDGLNDKFRIVGLPEENITEFNFQIFDRWGQLVFGTNDINDAWDGTNKGKICPPEVYSWVMWYKTSKKTKITNKGQIMLIR